MKPLLALTAFFLCAAAGWRKSLMLSQRKKLLSELSAMLVGFSIGIRCTAATLDELCDRAEGRFAQLLLSCREECPDIRSAWEAACDRLSAQPLFAEEAALLREFGAKLGSTDAAGQLALIELYGGRLSEREKSAADELSKKEKLYRSVGALCGLGAAIIII